MKWYHFSVEYFEDLRNVNHCEFLIMRQQENGKYLLENNLRTWSDLRRERALKEAREAQERGANGTEAKEKDDKDNRPDARGRAKSYTLTTRRWGGCPNGCNHSSHYVKKREDLEVLREKDAAKADAEASVTTTTTTVQRWPHSSDDDGDDEMPKNGKPTLIRTTTTTEHTGPNTPRDPSSPGISRNHLHVGRDGGGTYSGHASTAGSDTDFNSDDEHYRKPERPVYKRLDSLNARIRVANAERLEEEEKEKAGVMRLGDMTPDEEDLDKAEQEDRSIRGSVY